MHTRTKASSVCIPLLSFLSSPGVLELMRLTLTAVRATPLRWPRSVTACCGTSRPPSACLYSPVSRPARAAVRAAARGMSGLKRRGAKLRSRAKQRCAARRRGPVQSPRLARVSTRHKQRGRPFASRRGTPRGPCPRCVMGERALGDISGYPQALYILRASERLGASE